MDLRDMAVWVSLRLMSFGELLEEHPWLLFPLVAAIAAWGLSIVWVARKEK